MENHQFERLLHEIGESRRHTDEVAGGLRDELKAYTDAAVEETKRHVDVSVEGLRGEVRFLAEVVGTSNERIDRLGESLRAEITVQTAETRSLIKLPYADLDRRLRVVESARPSG